MYNKRLCGFNPSLQSFYEDQVYLHGTKKYESNWNHPRGIFILPGNSGLNLDYKDTNTSIIKKKLSKLNSKCTSSPDSDIILNLQNSQCKNIIYRLKVYINITIKKLEYINITGYLMACISFIFFNLYLKNNPNTSKLNIENVESIDISTPDNSFNLKNLVTQEIGNSLKSDSPRPWGLYFQDSSSPQMEAIIELHNYVMYYLIGILCAVLWIMSSILENYTKNKFTYTYLIHGTLIELIWTIKPALILILIAFPSFKLLYITDDVTDPDLTVKVEAHQWYWSYEYADFLNLEDEFISYDSYMINEAELEPGRLRMLEVDNRIILPELSHTRFNIASTDVIHSLACPSLGVKCDAYPYKSNQISLYSNREGIYFGQCSEICGIFHSSMPIVIQSVSLEKFLMFLRNQ